jgi:hypothetical protein
MCQRRATTRLGERLAGPICPETLAKIIVKLNVWELEVLFHGAIRALANMGAFSPRSPAGRMAPMWGPQRAPLG